MPRSAPPASRTEVMPARERRLEVPRRLVELVGERRVGDAATGRRGCGDVHVAVEQAREQRPAGDVDAVVAVEADCRRRRSGRPPPRRRPAADPTPVPSNTEPPRNTVRVIERSCLLPGRCRGCRACRRARRASRGRGPRHRRRSAARPIRPARRRRLVAPGRARDDGAGHRLEQVLDAHGPGDGADRGGRGRPAVEQRLLEVVEVGGVVDVAQRIDVLRTARRPRWTAAPAGVGGSATRPGSNGPGSSP